MLKSQIGFLFYSRHFLNITAFPAVPPALVLQWVRVIPHNPCMLTCIPSLSGSTDNEIQINVEVMVLNIDIIQFGSKVQL